MNKNFVKYLFILGFFLLGISRNTFAGEFSRLTEKCAHSLTEKEAVASGKQCFVHAVEIDKPGHFFVQEEWEEEEESSESFTSQLQGLLSSPFISVQTGDLFLQQQKHCYFPNHFAGTTRCRYLLFRVFRI